MAAGNGHSGSAPLGVPTWVDVPIASVLHHWHPLPKELSSMLDVILNLLQVNHRYRVREEEREEAVSTHKCMLGVSRILAKVTRGWG